MNTAFKMYFLFIVVLLPALINGNVVKWSCSDFQVNQSSEFYFEYLTH